MNKKTILMLCIVLSIFVLNNVTFANEKIEDWKYSKNIIVNGENKYKSIFLDEDVYRNSKYDYSDIRVIDNEGNFVPYYLSNEYSELDTEFVEQRFNRINKFKKYDDTFYDFKEAVHKFGMDNLTNKLKVFVDRDEFLLDIIVYGSFDGNKWDYIKNDRIYKIENLKNASVYFENVKKYTHYRIKVLNNIEDIEIEYLIGEYDYIKSIQKNYVRNKKIEYNVEDKKYQTDVTIKNDNRLRISDIKLDIEGIFKRDYSVDIKNGNSFAHTNLIGQMYNLEFKHLNVENTNIELKGGVNNDIKITFFNYDDQPLKINDIDISYFVDKLVFEAKQGREYKLYFGNINATIPKYDIEEYSSHIEAETQDECSFGILESYKDNMKIEKEYDFKIIFNVVMIMISVILVVFIGMKLKAKTE